MGNLGFNFETFTNLMKVSPQRAFEYRDNCHKTVKTAKIDDLSDDLTSDDIIVEKEEIIADTDVNSDDINFTREDLIAKLKNAGISFVNNSKDETLLKKCVENNLI